MADPRKRNARRAPGGIVDTGQQASAQITADPRIAQGIATRRHADQRAPTYPDPPGSAAARLLERLWGKP